MVRTNATYTQKARQLIVLNWNLPVGINLDEPLAPHLPPKAVTTEAYASAGLTTIGQLLWYVQQGGGIGVSPPNMGPKQTLQALNSILDEYQLKD